jgi:hypothetical protein
MRVGLLWFDNRSDAPLQEKVRLAAVRYRQKFGQPPNCCYVHPDTLAGTPAGVVQVNGFAVRVIPMGNILPHHFWIGLEENPQ